MRQIGFKNFRRFEDFPMLNLGDITILVGRNNAGKSTMIKAILLLLDNLKYTPNNLRAISNGDIPEFHFDALQPHNAHIGTFTRALNNKAAKDELILEATFTDIKYDRTSSSHFFLPLPILLSILIFYNQRSPHSQNQTYALSHSHHLLNHNHRYS